MVAALAFTLACNLPLIAAGQKVFLSRALLNIDYAAICLLALILRRPLILAVALPAVFVVDLIFSFAPAYHFSALSAWQSLRDLGQLDRAYVALVATGLATVAAIVGVIASRIAAIGNARAWARARTWSFALTLMLINALAVLLDGHSLASDHADVRATATNHAGSTVNNLALAWRTGRAETGSESGNGHVQAVAASAQLKQIQPPPFDHCPDRGRIARPARGSGSGGLPVAAAG